MLYARTVFFLYSVPGWTRERHGHTPRWPLGRWGDVLPLSARVGRIVQSLRSPRGFARPRRPSSRRVTPRVDLDRARLSSPRVRFSPRRAFFTVGAFHSLLVPFDSSWLTGWTRGRARRLRSPRCRRRSHLRRTSARGPHPRRAPARPCATPEVRARPPTPLPSHETKNAEIHFGRSLHRRFPASLLYRLSTRTVPRFWLRDTPKIGVTSERPAVLCV